MEQIVTETLALCDALEQGDIVALEDSESSVTAVADDDGQSVDEGEMLGVKDVETETDREELGDIVGLRVSEALEHGE